MVRSFRRLRARAPQRSHLRAGLDLEDAGRLALRWMSSEGLPIVEGDPREVDRLPSVAGRCAPRSARPRRASRARAGRSSGSRHRRRSPCPTAPSAGPPSRRAARGSSRSADASISPSRRGAGRGGAAAHRPRRRGARASPSARCASLLRLERRPRCRARPTPREPQPSEPLATRSISPAGRPSALPSSRIAPRAR